MLLGIKVMGLHQIVIGISVSLICMVIGSLIGKPNKKEVLTYYFPDK